ncbi:Myb-like_DNA-binding domain-containing protein [Hexamita inflata]|uniref:Myb-like DNA-binding domain-containing protein n=1 Tax=Hexamita inflata TaxID=28002 RepID=A0AA86UJP1_9EUKA|nr:Myb-like DNA-binding domain-containing protein [Hexamita inflata]
MDNVDEFQNTNFQILEAKSRPPEQTNFYQTHQHDAFSNMISPPNEPVNDFNNPQVDTLITSLLTQLKLDQSIIHSGNPTNQSSNMPSPRHLARNEFNINIPNIEPIPMQRINQPIAFPQPDQRQSLMKSPQISGYHSQNPIPIPVHQQPPVQIPVTKLEFQYQQQFPPPSFQQPPFQQPIYQQPLPQSLPQLTIPPHQQKRSDDLFNISQNGNERRKEPRESQKLERRDRDRNNDRDFIKEQKQSTKQSLNESKDIARNDRWTDEEHNIYLDAVEQYGRRRQTQITEHVKTKTVKQVISHSQKFFLKLDKAMGVPVETANYQDIIVKYLKPAAISISKNPTNPSSTMIEKIKFVSYQANALVNICPRQKIIVEWFKDKMEMDAELCDAIAGWE